MQPKKPKIKIAFVIYRHLAYEIFKDILAFQKKAPYFSVEALITTSKAEFKIPRAKKSPAYYVVNPNDTALIDSLLEKHGVSVVLYYGWSWIVKEPILSKYLCLCLHPSLLPKYRGGTPYQHQIMNGETKSGVTVFKMETGIDDGDIYEQLPMSLAGTLDNISNRVTKLGTKITKQLLADLHNNKLVLTPQKDLEKYPPLKRRPPEYEIVLQLFAAKPYVHLYNFVRALGTPYPSAYITMPEGRKLSVLEIQKRATVPRNGIVLNEQIPKKTNVKNPMYLKVRDGYAFIKKFHVEKLPGV